MPAAKQQKGFKGLYLLHDRNTGKGLTISLWETEADHAPFPVMGFQNGNPAQVADLTRPQGVFV